jgi:hypothetical protein
MRRKARVFGHFARGGEKCGLGFFAIIGKKWARVMAPGVTKPSCARDQIAYFRNIAVEFQLFKSLLKLFLTTSERL